IIPVFPSTTTLGYLSYFFMRENRLKLDCLQAYELGQNIIYYSNEDEPILCISDNISASRFYYILERRPIFKDLLITLPTSQIPIRFQELFEFVKKGGVSVVVLEDSLERTIFNVIPIEEWRKILESNYRKIPLRFYIDKSRKRLIELYILKNREKKKIKFFSRIFPKPCLNYEF
ncbi:MAG: hypothetical protein NC826_03510, partial [Candidatus Omnitrophica bacterium]|nr:hypothetical protein [Candidatus Omnitrophota bacterium]